MRSNELRSNLNNTLPERKCPVCKKVFVVPYEKWGYTIGKGDKAQFFCSWHCLRQQEQKTASREITPEDIGERVRELVMGKLSQREICRRLGIGKDTARYWIQRVEMEDESEERAQVREKAPVREKTPRKQSDNRMKGMGFKVVEMIKENRNREEICRELGISRSTYAYWKQRVEQGKTPVKTISGQGANQEAKQDSANASKRNRREKDG